MSQPRTSICSPSTVVPLIVVDMQNDFGSPGGMFDAAGIDIRGIAAVERALPPVLRAAHDAGIPVVYLKMEHAPDLSDVGGADAPHRIKHVPMGVGDGRTLIREARVAVSPGSGFGPGGDGHVRFALVENEHRIGQAIRGLRAALPELARV